ncbi:hypothetical protein [Azotobacter salinestris]|uniref:hypothetical protein n=1 Tax=Azotobacter salinestris TaxID=69964 RepID=UPI0032DE3EC7
MSIIIAIEALLLLLPATLFYFCGMLIVIFVFFSANKGGVTPAFLVIAAFLLLPGYGLYSLWWPVAKHWKVSPCEVPRFIWGGIIVGGLVASLFISPYVISGLAPPTPFISHTDNFAPMLSIGGGPLLVILTLLVIMQPWRKSGQL